MIYMYMTFFFLLKNKIATPIPGRFSAAFTAVAARAVPSIHIKDMQHEGTGLSTHSL